MMKKETYTESDLEIEKLKGDIQVHEEKFKAYNKLISKNNHRAEKGIEKAMAKSEKIVKDSKTESEIKFRNAYYVIGLFMAVLTLIFGMLQRSDSSNQEILTSKIDKNEERISNLLKENAKLQGELNGLRLYTETEIQDRKDYSNVNDVKISELQKKLADDNLKLLELLSKQK